MPEQSYVALRVLFDEGAWVLTCFARIRYSRMLKGRGRCRSGIKFVSLLLEYQKLIKYTLELQDRLVVLEREIANPTEIEISTNDF